MLSKQFRFATLVVCAYVFWLQPICAIAAWVNVPVGQYVEYDTDSGTGVLYNSGTATWRVDVVTDNGAGTLDTLKFDFPNAGAVGIQSSGALTGEGAALFTDVAADVDFTLQTGIAIAVPGGATIAADYAAGGTVAGTTVAASDGTITAGAGQSLIVLTNATTRGARLICCASAPHYVAPELLPAALG